MNIYSPIKKCVLILALGLFASTAKSAIVVVTNLAHSANSAYALFTQEGGIVPGTTRDNLRLGYFNLADAEVQQLWAQGNLAELNHHFVQFGAAFGMFDDGLGYDGIFEGGPSVGSSNSFAGFYMTLWASNGSDFFDPSAEYLIFRSDETFNTEPWFGGLLDMGYTAGSLLVGEFGNYSHDYELGEGPTPGFNTVGVIPEPVGMLLLSLGGGLLCLSYRRRKR